MSARVLVVDDVPANVKLLEARLSAEYFDVLTASNGAGSASPAPRRRSSAASGIPAAEKATATQSAERKPATNVSGEL